MYPHERSLVKKLADFPFAIVGVNSDRDLDSLHETLEKENITWRSFWNGPDGTSGPISQKWGVSGWPTLYLLDAEGKIRDKNVRGVSLEKAITSLLAEMGHEVDLSDHAEDEDDNSEEEMDEKEGGDEEVDEMDGDDREGDDEEADDEDKEMSGKDASHNDAGSNDAGSVDVDAADGNTKE